MRPEWRDSGHNGQVVLQDLTGADPVSEAALWRFLFGIDLTTSLKVRARPMDEAWQHLVSDIRRCELRVRDSLHVRLVDVGAALEARTYQAPVDVVLEVEDAFCPWNSGRWRLSGDGKGAVCVRTSDAADLALSVRELGAAYLGVSASPRWRGPGGCGSSGRARWQRPRWGSARPRLPGCRTGSDRSRRPRVRPRRGPGAPGQFVWQVGHQKRLRAARSAVRTVSPQRWQGWSVRR